MTDILSLYPLTLLLRDHGDSPLILNYKYTTPVWADSHPPGRERFLSAACPTTVVSRKTQEDWNE